MTGEGYVHRRGCGLTHDDGNVQLSVKVGIGNVGSFELEVHGSCIANQNSESLMSSDRSVRHVRIEFSKRLFIFASEKTSWFVQEKIVFYAQRFKSKYQSEWHRTHS